MPPTDRLHPVFRSQQRGLLGSAAFFAILAVGLFVWLPDALPSLLVLPLAGSLAWVALLVLPQRGRALQQYNRAVQSLHCGRENEVEPLLDQISPRQLRQGVVALGSRVVRAVLAFHRGDAEKAVAFATDALDVPVLRGIRVFEQVHRVRALTTRALAHASLGHEKEAEADAIAAEASPAATAEVLARTNLARSLVLARRNDRRALAAHFARHAGLMLEWLSPRERSLVRALRRMARAQGVSVYRESTRPDDGAEVAALASWIGKLAPGAEVFAREASRHVVAFDALPRASTASPTAMAKAERSHGRVGRGKTPKRAAIWAALAVTVFAMWRFVVHPSAAPDLGHTLMGVVWMIGGLSLFLAVFVALAISRGRVQRRQGKDLHEARMAGARGDLVRASATLTVLTQSKTPVFAVSSRLMLAGLASRSATWGEVLEHCDAGLTTALGHPAQKGVFSDALLPALVALRAYALAASDRPDEARAEMAVLEAEYPRYIRISAAEFSVRLVSAVRAGDLEAAVSVAMTRTPNLPLSIRDDMLADVVLAATTDMGRDERERIDGELADDSGLRAWIDAVGPGLLQRSSVRVASSESASRGDTALGDEEEHEDLRDLASRAVALR